MVERRRHISFIPHSGTPTFNAVWHPTGHPVKTIADPKIEAMELPRLALVELPCSLKQAYKPSLPS